MTGKCRARFHGQQRNRAIGVNGGGGCYAAAASAACASVRMRSTMERNPFDRCGVRCSRRPRRSNTAIASVDRMARACWPENIANKIAMSPRTIWASLSPQKVSTGPPWPFGCTAGPPLALVRFGPGAQGQGAHREADVDQIAVTVVPLLQQRKVVDGLVER